jgi:hypothetical protein
MARTENSARSTSFTITVSAPSAKLLQRLAEMGIYGRSRAVVAAGFVEKRIQELVESGFLKLDPTKKNKR